MNRPVDPDVARFAAALRERQQKEEREQARAAQVREMTTALELARADKQTAVERLKSLRESRAPRAQMMAAEAAYRSALAALLELETGRRPDWAGPAPEASGEPAGDATPSDAPDDTTDASADAPEAPDGPGDSGAAG